MGWIPEKMVGSRAGGASVWELLERYLAVGPLEKVGRTRNGLPPPSLADELAWQRQHIMAAISMPIENVRPIAN